MRTKKQEIIATKYSKKLLFQIFFIKYLNNFKHRLSENPAFDVIKTLLNLTKLKKIIRGKRDNINIEREYIKVDIPVNNNL